MPQSVLTSAPVEPSSQRKRLEWQAAQAAILVLAGFFVFMAALHGAWLWDDGFTIKGNALMADAGGWWKFWVAPPGPDYFPLTSTVEWGLWRVFGDHTLPYHLTSLALHLLSAFLLWRLFTRLGLRFAWLGALLFVVHPLVVESVAWISELKNTVSLPLLLLSMLCWLRYDEHGRPIDLSASLLLFLAAMLAKTSVVMLPCVLVLYTWWKHGHVPRKRLIPLAQFFAIALVLGVLTVCFQQQWAIGDEKIDVGGVPTRIAGAGWAILFYLGKCIWPVGLQPAYAPWAFRDLSPMLFLPWIILIAAFVWIWSRRKAWGRSVLFGLGFFVLNLAPVLGFVPMSYMRIAWVADHFVYLPIIGLIGLAIGSAEIVRKLLPEKIYASAATALLFALALQSRVYAANFRNQEALWSYTLKSNPDSWLAGLDLGLTLNDAHRLPEAEAWLERSIQLHNDFYGTHVALADILAQKNRLGEAATQYRIAWRQHPESLEIHINYGNVLFRQGDLKGAEQQYYLATLYQPQSVVAHYNLANILMREGRRDESMAQYQAVVALDPDYADTQAILKKLRDATPAQKNP
jgi:tetratricopeptide (TPR) repeat protein